MIKIFGYGSLLNIKSLKETVPSARDVIPSKINGYVRIFNMPSPYRRSEIDGKPCSVLNIKKSKGILNGICFNMDEEDLKILSIREKGYDLIDVEAEDVYGVIHMAKTFKATKNKKCDFIYESKKQKEYLEMCFNGCKAIGKEFLKEFMETTFIGEKKIIELQEILS